MTRDRRSFLKATGVAVSAAAVGACAPDPASRADAGSARDLDAVLLAALGEVVFPSELDAAGQEQAVRGFRRWASGYEAVPELNHGYGTAEIRYGPPDPVPAWSAQLQALEIEATKRHGSSFAELDPTDRDALVRRHISDAGSGMPSPLRARHVAVAMLSHWLSTPEATDHCYGVLVTPLTCRGLDNVSREPEDLT